MPSYVGNTQELPTHICVRTTDKEKHCVPQKLTDHFTYLGKNIIRSRPFYKTKCIMSKAKAASIYFYNEAHFYRWF